MSEDEDGSGLTSDELRQRLRKWESMSRTRDPRLVSALLDAERYFDQVIPAFQWCDIPSREVERNIMTEVSRLIRDLPADVAEAKAALATDSAMAALMRIETLASAFEEGLPLEEYNEAVSANEQATTRLHMQLQNFLEHTSRDRRSIHRITWLRFLPPVIRTVIVVVLFLVDQLVPMLQVLFIAVVWFVLVELLIAPRLTAKLDGWTNTLFKDVAIRTYNGMVKSAFRLATIRWATQAK